MSSHLCQYPNDVGRYINVQFAGGVIVEEKQRFGAHDGNIVTTHGNKVDADSVVPAELHGKAEFVPTPSVPDTKTGL